MADRKILLCLFVLCTSLYLTECGRFGGSRSSSRGGGSSWGKSWGGGSSSKSSWGSSGSSYKPSHSWSTGSSSSGSSYKPSSSSSGSSWWSSGSSKSPGYPSSSSGLSGSGSGSHGYPSSSSGLSGSGSSYKPSSGSSGSSWWSSGSSGSHGYPSSSTGLSGSGSGSRYPSSSSGLSGSGSGTRYPSSGSGSTSHSYPSGTGLSGSGTGGSSYRPTNTYNTNTGYGSGGSSYRPTNTYNTNSGYGSGSSYHSGSYVHSVPTYYHYPQHVYVTEYRDSGSRYGDLLTGLTFYNLGRSHSYNNHYYYDDYYRRRYDSPSSSGYYSQDRPRDEATCTLRVQENGKLELLKIPCEIVSTFTEGSQKVNSPTETHVNTTVCTTNTTVIKRTAPENVPVSSTTSPIVPGVNITPTGVNISNMNIVANGTDILNGISVINGTVNVKTQATEGNTTTATVRVINSTEEIVNVTVCTTTSSNGTDPLSVKGPPIDPSAMECAVDIKTKDAFFRNKVDCATLMKYSKMPPPKKEKTILPERAKLKKWLSNPPWWMSMFIAV